MYHEGFRSQRFRLRQHGTLSLLYVVFSPGGGSGRMAITEHIAGTPHLHEHNDGR